MFLLNKKSPLVSALFALTLSSSLFASYSFTQFLQDNQWTVLDQNNQPVAAEALESSHSHDYQPRFGMQNLPADVQYVYQKIQTENPTINDIVSSNLGTRTTVPGGERTTRITNLTNDQRERLFVAQMEHFRSGLVEQRWDDYYVGQYVHPEVVYVSDASTVYKGKTEVYNGVAHKTKLFCVDNTGKSAAEIEAFLNSQKKSQMAFELLGISIQDNVVALSVDNILYTAKQKTSDFERRFQVSSLFYWDFDENDNPVITLMFDTLAIPASGARIAAWLIEDTLEGGNAAKRAAQNAF